jgi:hypothetical protein
MDKRFFKILLFPVLALVFSCAENRKSIPEANLLKSSILLFGVGYDPDMAETDLNSVYYAFRQGYNYRFSENGLLVSLDYSNRTAPVTVEDLTYARLKKINDNFYIYELPYTGTINIRGGKEKRISAAITIKKPSGYLARMLTIAVMNELGNAHDENESGHVYLLSLNYRLASDNSLIINAGLLLTREE